MSITWKSHVLNSVSVILLLANIHHVMNRDVRRQHESRLPDYAFYHNLSHIHSHLRAITSKHPDYMYVDWTHLSRLGAPQMLLRIANFTSRSSAHPSSTLKSLISKGHKLRVLLSYGEHPREFFPVETLFHLLDVISRGLVTGVMDRLTRSLLSDVDLFIVVMMNPDGRQYVENTGNYCWRGTSTGVDLNRNFDWNFGQVGSSGNREDEEYRGSRVFSEPESGVLTELTLKYHFDAFLSLHSGIQQIYVPFADSVSQRSGRTPTNVKAMLQLAKLMSTAGKDRFQYGVANRLNQYPADGTILDFMAGVRKIQFSLAIELWGKGDHDKAKCFDVFNPENDKLQAEVAAIYPLYGAFFLHLIQWKHKDNLKHTAKNPCPAFNNYIIVTLILSISLVAITRLRKSRFINIASRFILVILAGILVYNISHWKSVTSLGSC